MKQKKILSLDLLLTQHWAAYNPDISPVDWFNIVDLPFSIYEFMPFFKTPLYQRKRVSFAEKSQKIVIELDFPSFSDLRDNLTPLFGKNMGQDSKHYGFTSYNTHQYKTLVMTIAASIDSSIESRKKLMNADHNRKWGDSTKQVNGKNSIKGNILWSDEKTWIWDLSDLIRFTYGKRGLKLQNLQPTKNFHERLFRNNIPEYTKFNHTTHKFVTTLEGFDKREIYYLKRYFNFDLKKTNSVKGFEYNSLDKGIGEWEHYIFSGLGDDDITDSWSFGDVDFLEKMLWYFDFQNENYSDNSNVRISQYNYQNGSIYWQFCDQKIIQVNDLSKGEFIQTPAHALEDCSYLDASDIESSDIETLLTLGIKPEEIREAVGAFMVDWNIGNDFPEWNEHNVKRDLKNRAFEIHRHLDEISNDDKEGSGAELKPMEELVMTCVEFYFKYGEEIDATVARDIEPDALRVEEIIAIHPELNKREFNPGRKKNISWISLNLNEFLNPWGKTSIWFFCENVQTKEAFLKLLPKDLKWKEAPSKVTNPELRFLVEIEKWDMIALKKILETKNKKSLESKIF